MATKEKKPRKPKQGFLPDMEPPSISELDGAAEIYDDAKLERCKLSKAEDEAKNQLIDLMHKHKLIKYETTSGIVVEMLNKTNVKTKHKKSESQEGDDE